MKGAESWNETLEKLLRIAASTIAGCIHHLRGKLKRQNAFDRAQHVWCWWWYVQEQVVFVELKCHSLLKVRPQKHCRCWNVKKRVESGFDSQAFVVPNETTIKLN